MVLDQFKTVTGWRLRGKKLPLSITSNRIETRNYYEEIILAMKATLGLSIAEIKALPFKPLFRYIVRTRVELERRDKARRKQERARAKSKVKTRKVKK